jgi:hypothetical protein
MFKATPNPPETAPTPQSAKSKAKQQDETTKRVLDHYLLPKPDKSKDEPKPGQLYAVVKGLDNECLLANLTETLASADAPGVRIVVASPDLPPKAHRGRKETGCDVLFTRT